jgi:hypothetical protein
MGRGLLLLRCGHGLVLGLHDGRSLSWLAAALLFAAGEAATAAASATTTTTASTTTAGSATMSTVLLLVLLLLVATWTRREAATAAASATTTTTASTTAKATTTAAHGTAVQNLRRRYERDAGVAGDEARLLGLLRVAAEEALLGLRIAADLDLRVAAVTALVEVTTSPSTTTTTATLAEGTATAAGLLLAHLWRRLLALLKRGGSLAFALYVGLGVELTSILRTTPPASSASGTSSSGTGQTTPTSALGRLDSASGGRSNAGHVLLDLVLGQGSLIAGRRRVERNGGEDDGDGRHVTSGLDCVKALLERLVHVGDIGGRDLGDLVQVRDSPLDDLSDGDCFVDGTTHGLENHLAEAFLLEQRSGIRDGVPHLALGGDTDLIVLNLGLFSGFLDLLILVHLRGE